MESKFEVLLIAALALLLVEHSSAISVSSPRTVRSAEWDDYMMARNRERRRTTNLEWECRMDNPTCTLTGLTTYDALERRASGLLATPQDQGNCGGCWAFASVHAYTDKLSIRDAAQAGLFSPEYNTRCYRGSINRNGCCGASDMVDAVMFLEEGGTVTATCLPYTLINYPPGAITRVQTLFNSDFFTRSYKRLFPLSCPTACTGAGTFNPLANRVRSIGIVFSDEQVIGLLDGGETVVATMYVNSDFQGYRCGVYSGPQISGNIEVNHAVEVVDYSNSSFPGTPYWVVKNSWGPSFGEGGYFRIARDQMQLQDFLYLRLNPPLEGEEEPDFSTARQSSVCAAETVTNPSQDPLVMAAASAAVGEMNSGSLIECSDPSRSATVSLMSIINATLQVVQGYTLEIGIMASVEGCIMSEESIILLTIDASLDGSFTLTNYSYDALSDSGDSNSAVTITAYTVAMLMLTIFTLMLLLIG